MISPATAKPRGALNTPIKENNNPRTHVMIFKAGIQQTKRPIIDNTKPAIAMPFDLCSVCWMYIFCAGIGYIIEAVPFVSSKLLNDVSKTVFPQLGHSDA